MKAPAAILGALALALAGCGGEAPAANAAAAAVARGFPALTGRVVDQAQLLTPADEQRLAAAAETVERETGAQFVIVTVPELGGRAIADYGVDLGRTWGIGRRGHDDGVLLIVAVAERQMRIEVGYGLERRITDPFAAKVIREQVRPRFQAGDFPGGISAGSEAIIARLRSRQSDREIAAMDGMVT